MICRDRNVQLHRQAKQLIQEKNSIYKATTSVVHRASYIWLARVAITKLYADIYENHMIFIDVYLIHMVAKATRVTKIQIFSNI